jgi:hypothetical protein
MKTLLLFYGACLTLASLQMERFGWRHEGLSHRLLHFGCFACLAALARLAFNPRHTLACAVLASIAWGAAIEFAQHLVYHNPYEWEDLRDDAWGAAAGAAALLVLPFFLPKGLE